MRQYAFATVLSLGLLIGCVDESVTPDSFRPEAVSASASPHFLNVLPTAPPLVSSKVTFWAVQGQDREADLFYKKRSGPPRNSDRLSRFRVRKASVMVLPNGQTLAPGDSVLITITVVDSVHQILDFKPAGLKFKSRPADLTIWYLETNHDFNNDGVINGADAQLEKTFRIWKQHGTQPYVPVPTALVVDLDEAEIDVSSFTRFAVAY